MPGSGAGSWRRTLVVYVLESINVRRGSGSASWRMITIVSLPEREGKGVTSQVAGG